MQTAVAVAVKYDVLCQRPAVMWAALQELLVASALLRARLVAVGGLQQSGAAQRDEAL